MSRGNSLIASVILIGILGTLSIALQATTPTTEKFTQTTVTSRSQVAAAAEKPAEMGCFQGFKYKADTVKGDIKVTCTRPSPDCGAVWEEPPYTAANYRAAGAGACISVIELSRSTVPKCQRPPKNRCDLEVCVEGKGCKPANLKGDGQAFSPRHEALKSLAARASTGDTQAEQALQSINPALENSLNNAFKDQIEEKQQQLGVIQEEINTCASCTDTRNVFLKKQKDAAEKQLARMKELQDRLAAEKTELKPSPNTGCTANCDSGNDGGGGVGGGNPLGSGMPTGFQKLFSTLGKALGGGQGGGGGGEQQNPYQNQNPYQQCNPRYYCLNNALYWGTQRQDARSYYGSNCEQQLIQHCQYGCRNNACAQNTQNPTAGDKSPTATLTCGSGSDMIDSGREIALTFDCKNASGSTGSGFSTKAKLSGTATTIPDKPPPGVNTVEYGLTCTAANNQTATARCELKINVTPVAFVAIPEYDGSEKASMGWVTKGIKKCIVSTPDPQFTAWNEAQAKLPKASGLATTPELNQATEFVLTCTTNTDQIKEYRTTVEVDPLVS